MQCKIARHRRHRMAGARLLVGLSLGLLLVAGTGSAAEAAAMADPAPAVERGAFLYSSQSFFQVHRFGYLHQEAELAVPGSLTADVGVTWSNTWIDTPGRLLIDAEFVHVRARVAYVPGDAVELSLALPYLYQGGGELDGLIENFHDAIGVSELRRRNMPRDRLLVTHTGRGGGTPVLVDGRDAGVQRLAPVASLRWRVTERGADMPVAVTLAVDFPSLQDENPVVERRGHDVALGVSTGGRLGGRWSMVGSLAAVRTRSGDLAVFAESEEQILSAMTSLAWHWSPRHTVLTQLLVESPTARHSGTGFDEPATDLLVGWLGKPWPGVELQAAFVENLFVFSNDVDVAFLFAVSGTL